MGQRFLFAGKPKLQGLVWQMSHPKVDWLGEEDEEPQGRILPVYPLTEGLQQWQMRKIVAETVAAFGHLLEEIFPDDVSPGPRPLAAGAGDPTDPRPRQRRSNWPARGGVWPIRNFFCWA